MRSLFILLVIVFYHRLGGCSDVEDDISDVSDSVSDSVRRGLGDSSSNG